MPLRMGMALGGVVVSWCIWSFLSGCDASGSFARAGGIYVFIASTSPFGLDFAVVYSTLKIPGAAPARVAFPIR